MKYTLTFVLILVTALSSFSQGMFAVNYGELYSFGLETNRNHATVDYISNSSSVTSDTTLTHTYTSILPHFKLHLDIGSITDKDIIYFNFLYGININIAYNVNGERNIDNFPIAHFAETGFTYLKGEEYGKAFFGTVGLTFIPAFNTGEFFLGPTLSAGYQFEYDERLFQVYLKGGLGMLGGLQRDGIMDINGYNYDATYTYNSNIIGIGIIYRGLN